MDKGERDHIDNQAVVSVYRCFRTPVHPVRSDHGPGVRKDVVQRFSSSAVVHQVLPMTLIRPVHIAARRQRELMAVISLAVVSSLFLQGKRRYRVVG